MLFVKVWCLPNESEEKLQSIVEVVTQQLSHVQHSGVRDQHDFLILFPMDQMEFGLGTEILIEVGFTDRESRWLNLADLADTLAELFSLLYQEARVHVVVRSYDLKIVARGFAKK